MSVKVPADTFNISAETFSNSLIFYEFYNQSICKHGANQNPYSKSCHWIFSWIYGKPYKYLAYNNTRKKIREGDENGWNNQIVIGFQPIDHFLIPFSLWSVIYKSHI